MKFAVFIAKIVKVVDHPNADRLSINEVLANGEGFQTISAKLEDGSSRYQPGNLVVYVPEGAIVPEYLLRQGFWDEEKQKGVLAGSKGNRVKAFRIRAVESKGILFSVLMNGKYLGSGNELRYASPHKDIPPVDVPYISNETSYLVVSEGDSVAEFLNITCAHENG